MMFEWIKSNLPTVFVAAVVAVLVVLVVVKLIRDRKEGKSSCGGCCLGCPSAGLCHGQDKKEESDAK